MTDRLPVDQWIARPQEYKTSGDLRDFEGKETRVRSGGGWKVTSLRVEENVWGLALVRRSDNVAIGYWRDPEWVRELYSGKVRERTRKGEGEWATNQPMFPKR